MSALLNDPFFMLLSAALIGAIGYNIWQVVYRDKAWKQVEAETSLKFEERKKGKNRDQILGGVYHHRKLTLTDTNLPVFRNGKRKSDMLTSASTNVHMALENPKMLKLTLHRTTQIKRLNPIGVEEFDSRFNITCEPEPFAKSLLVSGKLRERLQQLKPG